MTHETRTAIVTGASRGIGAEIARHLAADGIRVAINYANSPNAAEALAAEITDAGGQAVTIHADLADPAAPVALFDAAEAAFGGIDILVNNAGMMVFSPLEEADDAQIDAQVALNLAAPIRLMREASRRAGKEGRLPRGRKAPL